MYKNYATEVVSLITETFADDETLMIRILHYLYQSSKDDDIKLQILSVFNAHNYCIECGEKMTLYHFLNENGDDMTAYDCIRCNLGD